MRVWNLIAAICGVALVAGFIFWRQGRRANIGVMITRKGGHLRLRGNRRHASARAGGGRRRSLRLAASTS